MQIKLLHVILKQPIYYILLMSGDATSMFSFLLSKKG